jgi:hypothetical protein
MEFSHKLIVGNTGEQAWGGTKGSLMLGKLSNIKGLTKRKMRREKRKA